MDVSTITNEPKAHKGLLREELLLLLHTFDLHLGGPRELLDETIAKAPKILRAQNLPGSWIKDLLIVSLDIEGHPDQLTKENGGPYQVGLSILDIRHLQSDTVDTLHESLLRTHHLCVGPERYFKRKSWKFCFGQSKHVTLKNLRKKIQKLIKKRDVILVLHRGSSDLSFLRAAQIQLRPLCVIDTQKAAQHPLQLDYRCEIEQMLQLLKCPFDPGMLDNAGNVANLTLRALLLIATIDAGNDSGLEPACEALLLIFEKIATEYPMLEKFLDAAKAELKKEFNTARGHRERKNAHKKEMAR